MTYTNCKRLYELKKKNGESTKNFISRQLEYLDVFLLNERITKNEYTELTAILTSGK